MQYRRAKKAKRASPSLWWGVGGIALAGILFIFVAGIRNGSAALAHGASRPVWLAGRWIGAGFAQVPLAFASRTALHNENADLKEEIARNEALVLEASALRGENERLKALLGREEAQQRVLATILVKPNRSPYDTIVIDIGADKGLVPGDRVFAHGELLIGVVEAVYGRSSRVTLFSSPGYQSSALLPESDITVDLTGTGGGGFELVVPRDVAVEEGSVLSSLSLTPYPVAIVGAQVSAARDSFKKVLARSPVNIQELKWVEVARH